MAHVKRIPYLHVFKFYGFRLLVISIIWFLYDFSTYSFGLYSNAILSSIYGDNGDLRVQFGWNTFINTLYLPGTIIGAFVSDWIGPRYCLALGVTLQAIVGFGMAGGYDHLARPENVAGFAVIYGIFLALGELGPGNNIGLLASKTSATGIRGMYYGIAAAMGKIGAYVGVRLSFPITNFSNFALVRITNPGENVDLHLPLHRSRRWQRQRLRPVPLLRLEQPVHPKRHFGPVLHPPDRPRHYPVRGRAVPGVP